MKKLVLSLVMGAVILSSSLNIASAADYWIWGQGGYNYYIVTEESKLLNDYSARAKMKEVSPNGGVYTYNLYLWEMKGELWESSRKTDLYTRNGRRVAGHNTLGGRTYDYMLAHR